MNTHTPPSNSSKHHGDKNQNTPQAKLPCPHPSASFWHSEPTPFLLQHRTTQQLPASADIVIIGAGITGVSIARYLSEDSRSQDLSVVLLEAREVCSGATGRNGGHCKPDILERGPEVARFEIKNVEAVRSYVEENDVQCEWESISGCVTYWNEGLFDQAKRRLDEMSRLDPDMAARIDVSEDKNVMERYRVRTECVGIMMTRHDAQLWPYKYVAFMAEELVRRGALNVQTHTPVTGIVEGAGVRVVQTSRGEIQARHVIVATNGYMSNLLSQFGDLIVPVRCQMSALHPPAGSARLAHSFGMVGFGTCSNEMDDYLVQRPLKEIHGQRRGGHLMYGGGRSFAEYETVGESDDDVVDPGEAGYLRRALPRMLDLDEGDGSSELVASHQWTGIKGKSRDNMPWVGRVPVQGCGYEHGRREWQPGVWLCGGYSGHGMPNATLCAKAVVDMVLAGEEAYEDAAGLLVWSGGLPRPYFVTWERLEAARRLPVISR